MHHKRNSLIRLGLAVSLAFAPLLGCSFNDVLAFARDFNLGGTVLNIDPMTYRFFTSGYQGPGVDPDIDPACVFPPFCSNDPFVGGGAP